MSIFGPSAPDLLGAFIGDTAVLCESLAYENDDPEGAEQWSTRAKRLREVGAEIERLVRERDEVLSYLDNAVRRWRRERDTGAQEHGAARCADYIDAYQSVRVSFFGAALPIDDAAAGAQARAMVAPLVGGSIPSGGTNPEAPQASTQETNANG